MIRYTHDLLRSLLLAAFMSDVLPPSSLTFLFNALQTLRFAIPLRYLLSLSIMLCETSLVLAIPSIVSRYCKCNSFIT